MRTTDAGAAAVGASSLQRSERKSVKACPTPCSERKRRLAAPASLHAVCSNTSHGVLPDPGRGAGKLSMLSRNPRAMTDCRPLLPLSRKRGIPAVGRATRHNLAAYQSAVSATTRRTPSSPNFPTSCRSESWLTAAPQPILRRRTGVMSKRLDPQATNKARDSTGNPCSRAICFGVALLLGFFH